MTRKEEAITVPIPNAFTINFLGNQPFPLSIECEQIDEILTAKLCALRVRDIADLISLYGLENSLVFEVSHVWILEVFQGKQRPLPLSKIAEEQKTTFTEIDQDSINVSTKSIHLLLDKFEHFDFHLLDSPNFINEEQLLDIYDIQKKNSSFLLKQQPNSNIYLDNHDDCYLYIETRNQEFLLEVISKLLQIFVGTIHYSTTQKSSSICAVPLSIFQDLGWPSLKLNALQSSTSILGESIQMQIELDSFNFRSVENKTNRVTQNKTLKYHLTNSTWELI